MGHSALGLRVTVTEPGDAYLGLVDVIGISSITGIKKT